MDLYDLIWIGNTLYPRWALLVVGGVVALILSILVILND